MPSGLEVEIKLAVDDGPEILRRLERAGAERETDRLFEDNRIFDFPDGRLRDREVMFRLRQFGDRWTTTLKERVPDEGDYKIRREYESEVSDGEAMLDVIRGLGMEPATSRRSRVLPIMMSRRWSIF